MKITIKFEPRDLWIGIYWNKEHVAKCQVSNNITPHITSADIYILKIYICIIPMLPIILGIPLPYKTTVS